MSKRFGDGRQRDSEHVVTDLPPFYWKAYGIALLLGLLIGLGWIAWHLIKLHVLG